MMEFGRDGRDRAALRHCRAAVRRDHPRARPEAVSYPAAGFLVLFRHGHLQPPLFYVLLFSGHHDHGSVHGGRAAVYRPVGRHGAVTAFVSRTHHGAEACRTCAGVCRVLSGVARRRGAQALRGRYPLRPRRGLRLRTLQYLCPLCARPRLFEQHRQLLLLPADHGRRGDPLWRGAAAGRDVRIVAGLRPVCGARHCHVLPAVSALYLRSHGARDGQGVHPRLI